MKELAQYHPIISVSYFALLILITMFTMHPILLLISFIGSLFLYAQCIERRTFVRHIIFTIFLILLFGITNPLFVHQGVSVITYLQDLPITMEAILYGFAFGCMLSSIVTLFQVFHHVVAVERFLYLFQHYFPSLALLISMVFQFLPRYRTQSKRILQAQQTLGMDMQQTTILTKVKNSVHAFSILTTWAFESSLCTVDSMKARGYGKHTRTSYQQYTFCLRDAILLSILALFGILLLYVLLTLYSKMYYYPYLMGITFQPIALLGYLLLCMLYVLPFYFDRKEAIKWRFVQSKM